VFRLMSVLAAFVAGVVLLVGGALGHTASNITGVAYFRQTLTSIHTNAFPGGTQVWEESVLLIHEARVIGHGAIACVYVTDVVRECYGTYVLPEGKVKVLGEITTRSNYTLAIIGGTGVYANGAGVATFTPGLVTFYFS
jgi:hypothetical protein